MIISHRLKFAFFRSPKTGSTTMSMMLRLSGAFDDNDICAPMPRFGIPQCGDWEPITENESHMTPATAVERGLITLDQLVEYQCFAALREPLGRSVSSFCHAFSGNACLINAQNFGDQVRQGTDWGILNQHQSTFFTLPGVTPVDFGNFQQTTRELVACVSDTPCLLIPNFNITRGKDKTDCRANYIDPYPEIQALLEEVYAEDIALYKAQGWK